MLMNIAMETDGVRNVHELRSRRMGHDILLDVHLVVRPEISVSEGHQIGMKVVAGMREALGNILDINFHIDAENDEKYPHPTRSEEHTSELQSRPHLVCRLLLEKKKKKTHQHTN